MSAVPATPPQTAGQAVKHFRVERRFISPPRSEAKRSDIIRVVASDEKEACIGAFAICGKHGTYRVIEKV